MNLKLSIIDLHQVPQIYKSNPQCKPANNYILKFPHCEPRSKTRLKKYLGSSKQYVKLLAKPKLDINNKRIQAF